MKILCLDIGNTNAHWGLLKWPRKKKTALERAGDEGVILADGDVPTALLDDPETGLPAVLARLRSEVAAPEGVSWCSVVPNASAKVESVFRYARLPLFHLRHDACPGLAILVPRPAEVGEDRLANAIAAQALYGAPTVVIDLGTAVTFDILTEEGYQGGIIAPGLSVMTRYLHEQTALLPQLDPAELIAPRHAIGKTTVEAMKVGCSVGFAGMIQALLERVRAELYQAGAREVQVVATGGSAGSLPKAWLGTIRYRPNLTLRGLAEAYRRSVKNQ